MNKEETLHRLQAQLAQLNRQFETIMGAGSKIPKLEMDRMLGDIRATYELFTVLNYQNTYPPAEAQPVAVTPEPPKAEPAVMREEAPVAPVTAPAPPAPQPSAPAPKTEKREEKVVDAYMKDKPLSLYEKHAETPTENVADKFRQQKVDDLKKIPLHEKFLFINELFAGDNVPYNQFIESVSAAPAWQEASAVFEEAKQKYRWDDSSKTYLKFFDLIRRKF